MLEVDIVARAGSFALRAAFRVPSDGIVAVFGRSGAGKSSLLNAIAGLLRPEAGRIALDDLVFFSSSDRLNLPIEQRGIGYVFQEGRLFPHLSVAQNLDYGAKRRRGHAHGGVALRRDDVIALLALEGLMQRRTPLLSGGERQRVAIGRALLAAPRMLLLDEPLAALDQARKLEIMHYIENLRRASRMPMLLVSHAIDEVARLAETMVVIERGEVIASGPINPVLTSPQLFGLIEAEEISSVIDGTLDSKMAGGLGAIRFAGGTLVLRIASGQIGAAVRVRVHASDVAISLEPLMLTSISNVLPARIVQIDRDDGHARLLLDLRGVALLASLTCESADRLALAPGLDVFALIKSVALIESGMAAGC